MYCYVSTAQPATAVTHTLTCSFAAPPSGAPGGADSDPSMNLVWHTMAAASLCD